MPLFSMITVLFNAKETVADTLASLEKQSFCDWESLIIDGGSTDGTVDLVKEITAGWDNSVTIVSEPDRGIYDAMNKGISLAKGDFVYMLNGDDALWDESVLEKTARAVEQNREEKDIYYGNLRYVDEKGDLVHHFKPSGEIRAFLKQGCITQQAIFYRKSIFEKVGLFNLKYSIVGDYEWLLRALFRKNITSLYIDIDMAAFQMGGVSNHPEHKIRHDRQRERLYLRFFPGKYINRRIEALKRTVKTWLKKS